MARCRQCGYELSADFKFCPQCTTPVVEKPLQTQPSQSLSRGPLSPGENELYRTRIEDGRILLVTNRRLLWLGKDIDRVLLSDLAYVVAELSWHFFGTPLVRIGVKFQFGLSGAISDQEIKCQSMGQANELKQKR